MLPLEHFSLTVMQNLMWASSHLLFFLAVTLISLPWSFIYPLSCPLFFPFTLIPTTILREFIVYLDEKPTALTPNSSSSWSSKSFSWTPFRLLMPWVPLEGIRFWCSWFQKPNSHLLTTASFLCDSHVCPLSNLRETPSSWFLHFPPSHPPLLGFSSFCNQPSPMSYFLTGFPTICSFCYSTKFPSQHLLWLKITSLCDELLCVWAVSSVNENCLA